MKKLLLGLFLSFNFIGFAQQEALSLDDAIMSRWSKFAPERLSRLQWIANSTSYCYVKDNTLQIQNLEGLTSSLSLDLLNAHFVADSLSSFPGIHWMDESSFRFSKGGSHYRYNVTQDKLTEILSYNSKAQNAEFSDDAMAIAYTIDNNLFIQDSNAKTHQITNDADKAIVNGQAVHRFEFGISKGTFWSNNGENLAFYRKDESMVSDYPLVNNDARIAEANIIKYPMAGMKSHHVTLGIYNLESGETIFVKTGEPKEQYLTNIAWGPKDEYIYIAVLNRDQNHMKLNKYDAKTGGFVKNLFEETHENYVQPLHPMLFVEGNDNEFLWRSERDGYDHFYRYNTNGKLMNRVTKGKWVVKDFIAFDGNSIILTGTHNNGLETQVYRSTIKASRSTMITSTEGVHRVQASFNGRFLLDSYNSLDNPGTIELIDHIGNSMRTLLQSKDPFENTEIAQTELYTIEAEDGTVLNCRMIKPSDFDANKK